MYEPYDQRIVEQYLQEIGAEPLLTAEEESVLAARIRGGDERALHRLTKANLRFVVSVAKKYQGQGLSLADLINEGNYGLIKAAQRFDETRGFKFISYAVWWIRQAILQALSEQGHVVRIPVNKRGAISRIVKATNRLTQTLGRMPTDEEVAEAAGCSTEQLRAARSINNGSVSLYAPISEGEDKLLIDLLMDDESDALTLGLTEESRRMDIATALRKLRPREQEVLRLYFGLGGDVQRGGSNAPAELGTEQPLTLEEIGARLGLTRERIRQIKEQALRRLRHHSTSRALRGYA